ncbi:MAG: gamma-glutamyl-gamma-aminobutyrate hydrolase family protein [Candidatus Sulfopaludibacter sp.]|nr:gamma-glutamyl-gamma-aminobutyrate hydrolase family protein [Candidatus Sulfopaludibacter sp.]
MRILVFRHVPFEDIGLIASALESYSVQIDYADLYRSLSPCPDPASYCALIFMGGPMSVNDDLPYIRRELEIVAQAAARRQPVLGICLGAQLIAKAMGARVYPNAAKEIGWYPVHFTQAAAQDPLLSGVDTPQEVFHWHGETFDLPAGAVHLASSALCRNQAFHIGRVLYGFQFHLEVSPEMIADWCTQDENCGDVRELPSPLDPQKNQENLRRLSQHVFSRWARRLLPLESHA